MILEAVSFGQMLSTVAKIFGKGKDLTDAIDPVLDTAAKAMNLMNTRSVSQSASRTLISPMVAIERDLIHQEYMTDVVTVVNIRDIKDALSHLALQGEVDGIKISHLIDQINPRRAGLLALSGLEAFSGNESAAPVQNKGTKIPATGKESPRVSIGGKEYSDLTTFQPLAVGRTVIASVRIGSGNPVEFPLNFRQVPIPVSSNDLEAIFSAARSTDGFFGRISMLQGGEITLPEFLTGTDEIKREFNIRMNDLSGYYSEAMARDSNNKKAALRTGLVSMNTMANTIIMSKATANQIELEHGLRFDRNGITKIRQKVMANTIVIIDDDSGLFTFWNAGQPLPEQYTRREIQVTAKKDTSMDLASLMKMFNGR
ncbi:putative capsid and scaffold protein [Aeromonas phage LAh10]|uniref:Putative capsid and scaffold protein n=1 Tax=Aeromonas phage LAh10 TaxID=2591025 RepID=A0A514A1D0_9CAUD|nr:putative capsid and scaffold protein [Aeromonas phage LAh10]QDH47070.1 putative capsid and scaffold protein [Aeromonas phage LAh10]